MISVIIMGNRDMASLAHFYLRKDSQYIVSGFTLNHEYIKEDSFEGMPIIPFEDLEKTHPKEDYCLFIPMYDNKIRAAKYHEAKNRGYKLISYVSSKAVVWSNVGDNCFIMENNTIQPYVKMGNNIMMWSGNHIGHHSIIGDHVFFTSHVVLSGHCMVEDFCWFGVNSAIRDGTHIDENAFINMSSSVIKNVPPNAKVRGNPAEIYNHVDKTRPNLR